MPSDDLLEHAKSSDDFYALLGEGIHLGSAEDSIRRAYRRTALKHHPDKNKDDPNAVEKFHALQIAFDVLSDPAAKAAYDNARTAREAKERQKNLFEGRRKTMMDDLERRESGAFKRKREEVEAEEMLERELRRLQEDGRRRRMEREEALRKEMDGEVPDTKAENGPKVHNTQSSRPSAVTRETTLPEIQRTVKVRWSRDGAGESLDKDKLSQMFSRFGKVESSFVMKDRKVRLAESKKKKIVGNGVIVYSSVVGAHAAVEDYSKNVKGDWSLIERVDWAEGKAPDFIPQSPPSPGEHDPSKAQILEASTPEKPPTDARKAFPGVGSKPSTPFSVKPVSGVTADGLRKVPSFASFSSANLSTPISSPYGKSVGSPSLEEITLIRLKNAEKKRLEEKIRREEAVAAKGNGETT